MGIGDDNPLVVQGGRKTYKKTNVPILNDFTEFEDGKGYWIKVDPNKFYIYKVIGWNDFDTNNDDIKDTNSTQKPRSYKSYS